MIRRATAEDLPEILRVYAAARAYMKANGAWLASCEEVARYVKDFYAKRAEGGEA